MGAITNVEKKMRMKEMGAEMIWDLVVRWDRRIK